MHSGVFLAFFRTILLSENACNKASRLLFIFFHVSTVNFCSYGCASSQWKSIKLTRICVKLKMHHFKSTNLSKSVHHAFLQVGQSKSLLSCWSHTTVANEMTSHQSPCRTILWLIYQNQQVGMCPIYNRITPIREAIPFPYTVLQENTCNCFTSPRPVSCLFECQIVYILILKTSR